jgi:hypothetical protein
MYERFAQNTHLALEKINPALAKEHRWGGYFSGPIGSGGKYGAMDTMHQDFGGGAGRMGAGNFETGISPEWKKRWGVTETAGTINTAREAAKVPPPTDLAKPLEGKPIEGLTPEQQKQVPTQVGPDKVTSNEALIKEAEATNMSPAEFLRRQATTRQPGEYGEAGEPGYQVAANKGNVGKGGSKGNTQPEEFTTSKGVVIKKNAETGKWEADGTPIWTPKNYNPRTYDPDMGKFDPDEEIKARDSTVFYTAPKENTQPPIYYTDPYTGDRYKETTKPIGPPAANNIPGGRKFSDDEPFLAYGFHNWAQRGKETLGGYYAVTPEGGPNAGRVYIFPHGDSGPGAGTGGRIDYNARASRIIYHDYNPVGGTRGKYLGKELPEGVTQGLQPDDDELYKKLNLPQGQIDYIHQKRIENEWPQEGSQIGQRLDKNANPLDNLEIRNDSNARASWDKPYGSNVRDLSNIPDPSERSRKQIEDLDKSGRDPQRDSDKPKESKDPEKPKQDIKDPEKADSSSDTSKETSSGDKSDATGGGQIESPA